MNLNFFGSGYTLQRINGVEYDQEYGDHIVHDTVDLEDYLQRENVQRQNGVIGCWLAHTRAIENTRADDGLTVVLEDDFMFRKDFFRKSIDMIINFKRDFDVLIFDPSGLGPKREHFLEPGIFNAKGSSYPYFYGSHCLFYNRRSIPKILKIKQKSKISDYDGFLLSNTSIKTYIFYTGESMGISLGSNISGSSSLTSFLLGIRNRFKFLIRRS
ncbi:hypothetical protein PVT68_04495 [Microbulbifer bruguierae]|uniref:Uncharacterized protein n=1 Tax=Microbulbifer bruguierae TaxID=3029061 RepID=A0ABY8NGM1_9GAMM|nr:hypothetical protein [Microbulbifer bruguierae]WGL17554.1 hypothetical protein PVT68_04495 [Microbulbifer bruguierae]